MDHSACPGLRQLGAVPVRAHPEHAAGASTEQALLWGECVARAEPAGAPCAPRRR